MKQLLGGKMSIIEINNMIRMTNKMSERKFKDLFDEKQQDEIMDFLENLTKKLEINENGKNIN